MWPASCRGIGWKRGRRHVPASPCAAKSSFWQSGLLVFRCGKLRPGVPPSEIAAAAPCGGETRGGTAKSSILLHIGRPKIARPERDRRESAPAQWRPLEEGDPSGSAMRQTENQNTCSGDSAVRRVRRVLSFEHPAEERKKMTCGITKKYPQNSIMTSKNYPMTILDCHRIISYSERSGIWPILTRNRGCPRMRLAGRTA